MITSHADMEELFEPDYNTENISLKDEGNKRRKIATDFIEDSFKNRENVSLDTLSILDREDGYSVIAWRLLNTTTNKIPSEYYPDCVYTPDLLKHLISNGKLICKKVYSNKNYGDSEIYYMFRYKGTIVNFMFGFSEDNPQGLIMNLGIIYNAGDDIYIEDYEPFIKKPKETAKIGIIKTTKYGPAVSWMEHKTDYTFSEDNYNDDFSTFYSDLKDKLKTNKTGLYLFYGEAGTGKSSAIRQLITDTDRKVVFLPPQMINCLASPDFTDLVLNSLKGSILVIEDAEKALMKRESEDGFHNSELVSTILNLTDGLYSDLAHISIIATYNCDRNLIDPALLRKGRLRSEYHFKKLSVDKSQKLVDSLNHDFDVDSPMTLAEIFNYEKQFSNRESEKKRSVGFGA
jgi:hypothetical protein